MGKIIVRTLKQAYFDWLCSIVGESDRYSILLQELHARKFEWSLPRDEDRALDGAALREQYIRENAMEMEHSLYQLDGPTSILEVLVALAKICSDDCIDNYDYQDMTSEFFWEMVSNLDLTQFSDDVGIDNEDLYDINERLDVWIYRKFEIDGTGSPFPLENPRSNQRNNLIWYQKEAYLDERYPA